MITPTKEGEKRAAVLQEPEGFTPIVPSTQEM